MSNPRRIPLRQRVGQRGLYSSSLGIAETSFEVDFKVLFLSFSEKHQNWKNGVTPEVTSSENTDTTESTPRSPTTYSPTAGSPGTSLGTSNSDVSFFSHL